jgi:hypothetical protein
MLQIFLLLLVFRFASHIGKIVRQKGRTAIGYQVLAVALWFGCQIAGALLGGVIAAVIHPDFEGVSALVYLLGFVGTLIGVGLAYAIANSLSPVEEKAFDPPEPELFRPSPSLTPPDTSEAYRAASDDRFRKSR